MTSTRIIVVIVLISASFFTATDSSDLTGHRTRYNEICTSLCDKRSEDYYGCYVHDGNYEQCSLDPDKTVNGKTCVSYHPCGDHGYRYIWCYTEDGEWDYCGNVWQEPCNTTVHYDRYGAACVTPCVQRRRYFRCLVNVESIGYGYCSPQEQTTIDGRATCSPWHPCGFHGEDYTWCYTDTEGNWDYCGLIHHCPKKQIFPPQIPGGIGNVNPYDQMVIDTYGMSQDSSVTEEPDEDDENDEYIHIIMIVLLSVFWLFIFVLLLSTCIIYVLT